MIRPVAARRAPRVRVRTRALLIGLGLLASLLALSPVAPSYAMNPPTRAMSTPAYAGSTPDSQDEEIDPLLVTIDEMSPSVIPKKGMITLRGTVTNDSLDTWREIKIYPRLSYTPLTTSAELGLAAESDPRLPFGDRITTEGHFDDEVAALEPGESDTWRIRLPRSVVASRIQGTEGTYQIGVQALGQSDEGRPGNAIGRARTFIPLMEGGHDAVDTSIVVPLRARVRRTDDGQLADEAIWTRDLATGGRLANIAELLDHSGGTPLSLLLDPAVLDAARQLADGNPPRALGAAAEDSGEAGGDTTMTMPAAEWLKSVTDAARSNEVLALPYGDLDVAAAATHEPRLLKTARRETNRALAEHDVTGTAAVAPPSGLLPLAAVRDIDPSATMLMSTEAAPGTMPEADQAPSRLASGQHTMTTYDPRLLEVPDGETTNAVSMRQRVLAEASVRSLSGSKKPLVVNVPLDFEPGTDAGGFFDGLDRSFIELKSLTANTGGNTLRTRRLDYPERQRTRELGSGALLASRDLIESGAALDDIVTDNETMATNTVREALTYVSYMQRDDAPTAELAARAADAWIRERLNQISIDAPSFVILSSAHGPFVVKVTNGLDMPVTVSITAHTRDDLEISAPSEIELEADSTRTVQLSASAGSIGVHPVELQVTDSSGRPVGAPEKVSVRSNQVGKVIWVILGVGVGILFLAIPVRWIRRHNKAKAAE